MAKKTKLHFRKLKVVSSAPLLFTSLSHSQSVIYVPFDICAKLVLKALAAAVLAMPSTSASALPRLTGERSIRLLRIKPARNTGIVECEVKTVDSLDHVHAFDALSYLWGDMTRRTDIIKLNDVEFPVTSNFLSILRHLRRFFDTDGSLEDSWDESHPLHSSHNVWRSFSRNVHEHDSAFNPRSEWLWIDLICINQDDLDERSSQVELMRDIYRTARSVRIWFGEEDPTPTPLGQYGRISRFTMKRHLGEFGSVPILLVFINQALRNNDSTGRVWYGQLIANMVPATRHRFHGFVPPAAAEWKIPAKFFDNDWFKRVWTIQEAAVSNVDNAVVVLGEWEIKWWAVGKAAQWFKENLYSSLPTQNATATWQITLQSKERVPLLTLLETARNRGASNGRDRVYAMLGLAKDINIAPGEPYSRLLRPNYRKTEQAVFHHAAMHLLKRDKTLSVLSHCEQSNTLAFYFSPSWVPVWSVPQAANPFPFKTTYAKCPFRADDGKERDMQLSDKVLNVKGVSFDRVATPIKPFGTFRDNTRLYREERDHIASIWDSVEQALKQQTPSYVREQAFRAFLLALTAGVDSTGKDGEATRNFQAGSRPWLGTYFRDFRQMSFRDRSAQGGGGRLSAFQNACARACKNRRIFVTDKGSIGLGPEQTEEGDHLVVLFGGKFPFILRRMYDGYALIGDCYVHGSMHGEVVMEWEENGSPNETFKIV